MKTLGLFVLRSIKKCPCDILLAQLGNAQLLKNSDPNAQLKMLSLKKKCKAGIAQFETKCSVKNTTNDTHAKNDEMWRKAYRILLIW